MEVTFYNKTNPNVILWNSMSNKILCKFDNGICKVENKNTIDKLIGLGLNYDSVEYKKYIDYLEAEKEVVTKEVKEDKKELATKEKNKKEAVKEKKVN